MYNDINNGKINLVIVKDLSRFDRNYIEVRAYVEAFKELSYPITTERLADGLKLDMENAVYMKNVHTDLFYNDDYLGVCILFGDENDVPKSIQTISVDNIHSEISL